MAGNLGVRRLQLGCAFKISDRFLRIAKFEMYPAKRINKKSASRPLFNGAFNQSDCLLKIATFIGPPVTKIIECVGITGIYFQGTQKMSFRCQIIPKLFQRHSQIAVQDAGIAAKRQRLHIGVTAVFEISGTAEIVTYALIKIGVVPVARDSGFQY